MTDTDPDAELRSEFSSAVNMEADELRTWLDTEESWSVGQPGEDGEAIGHAMGRRIVELLESEDGLTDDDRAAMRKVIGYVRRHQAQGPEKSDPATSPWRYSLMNWGHDPLK